MHLTGKENFLLQGSKGIRQWLINSCTSPMKIHKITHSEDYNQWLKSLGTWKLNKPNNQNSIKVPKVGKPTIKKRYYKTLGTSVINSSMSPYSLAVPARF